MQTPSRPCAKPMRGAGLTPPTLQGGKHSLLLSDFSKQGCVWLWLKRALFAQAPLQANKFSSSPQHDGAQLAPVTGRGGTDPSSHRPSRKQQQLPLYQVRWQIGGGGQQRQQAQV